MKTIDINRLLELGIAISAEKDHAKLFGLILNAALDITESDAGTLYRLDGDELSFHYMITRSKGVDFSADRGEISLPAVPLGRGHVCACCALDKNLINIPDIYTSDEYDFSGAEKYDRMNDYRTKSMLVTPMLDESGQCIGVLQLINGDFPKEAERIILALSSFAAVSLNNRLLVEEINDLLHSVVKMMVSAIDARSPYNANHTKSMVRYASNFLKWAIENERIKNISEEDIDPILMSVWLHDIGKLVIPLEVMDKDTRLGGKYEKLSHRITVGILMEEIASYKYPYDKDMHIEKAKELEQALNIINEINGIGFLNDELLEEVSRLSAMTLLDKEGNTIPLINEDEARDLSIRRGTLTNEERNIIESHVSYTRSMLENIRFTKQYKNVPNIASSHHEFIDGSGYPDKKKADDIPFASRLLTIIDIYDALTAEDRPYKPPMEPKKAFDILGDMAGSGKLDDNILAIFIESKAWEK